MFNRLISMLIEFCLPFDIATRYLNDNSGKCFWQLGFIYIYIYMPCVEFLTDQYRSYSPLESPEQRCALPGSTNRTAQCHLVCDCVLTTPVVNHIVSTEVTHFFQKKQVNNTSVSTISLLGKHFPICF